MTSAADLLTDDPETTIELPAAEIEPLLRTAKLIVLLDRADAEVRKLPAAKRFFGNEDDPVNQQLSKFVRDSLAVEYGQFTLQQKRELYWLYYDRLPETLRALKSMKRHEYDMFAAAAIENLNTHLTALLNGKTLTVAQTPKPSALPTVPVTPLLPGTRFPLYPCDSAAVTAALLDLGHAWASANAADLSTEDRYTVNAIVDSYLPEAWGMVQKLVGQRGSASAEAEKMFIEQLGLLHQQVDEINERSTQSALSNIQAYTRFLKGKLPKPGLELS